MISAIWYTLVTWVIGCPHLWKPYGRYSRNEDVAIVQGYFCLRCPAKRPVEQVVDVRALEQCSVEWKPQRDGEGALGGDFCPTPARLNLRASASGSSRRQEY